LTKLLNLNEEKWKEKQGLYTAKEIYQQPEMWNLTLQKILNAQQELKSFLEEVLANKNIRIILTGAGTSGFIGDTLINYIKEKYSDLDVVSVHTTNIVSHPATYLDKDIPTLLVSFARSGNSPESVATVNLAKQIVNNLYQLVITCNQAGKLAKSIEGRKNKVILLPEATNDKGFAMTSSFTSMLLAALLFFNLNKLAELEPLIKSEVAAAKKVINDFPQFDELLIKKYKKIIYLGSSYFYGLSKEASLKLLELSAGKTVTKYDTPLGFRHGPKSIIDSETLVVFFLSRSEYARLYEYDLLRELKEDQVKTFVISDLIDDQIIELSDYNYKIESNQKLDEVFNSLIYIIFAQIISLYNSINNKINPDNPSPDGSVNRVVKGVKIYPYHN
jgi:tagatose-6-phosphate ketose/aldose isomerase